MKTVRKFFDAQGEETTADKATSCHELEVNDEGQVVRDSIYEVEAPKESA
jgi:hypothetical protein